MKNNQKKGISLIVLVITIIIMIILAAAIILSLNGQNIIGRANEATYESDLKTMEEELSVKISEAILRGNPDEFEGLAAEDVIETAKKYPGKYIISNRKLVDTSTIIAPEWKLPEEDTTVNIGDLLTPTVEGLETEKFYVIADDGKTLTLLAEKNINVQTVANNLVVFDDSSDAYNGSTIQVLVNEYIGTLKGLKLEDVEVVYGAEPVAGVKGRLMWYEETAVEEETSPFKEAPNYRDILYGPSGETINYWLGSAAGNFGCYVYYVASENIGFAYSSTGNFCGVRPVIKILKSLVE